jgi:hypothetical protein
MSEDSYHVSTNDLDTRHNRHSFQSDASESSISGSTGVQPSGCAYLQALQLQLDHYPTTGGEYLEAIFTHREAFYSHPPAHRSCARGFSDIAGAMEKRVWRADRDSDAEAVVAFRYEARVIAAALY